MVRFFLQFTNNLCSVTLALYKLPSAIHSPNGFNLIDNLFLNQQFYGVCKMMFSNYACISIFLS